MALPNLQPEADGYITFRLRFQAWWHGVEPNAIVKTLEPGPDLEPTQIHVEEDAVGDGRQWPPARIAFAQRLWGEGFIDPGGRDYTLHLLNPCALIPEHSVLDMTTGLSGGAQAVCDVFGLWIDAMEADDDLAAEAQEFCVRKGYAKKVRVSRLAPDKLKLRKGRYDCIFARERFSQLPDKPAALAAMFRGLKAKGQLLLTDLVCADAAEGPLMQKWREKTGTTAPILNAAEYPEQLSNLKFDVLILQDNTAAFRSRVLAGWSAFVNRLDKCELTRDFVNLLVNEAERWISLMRAFDAGEMKLMRIHAIRPKFK